MGNSLLSLLALAPALQAPPPATPPPATLPPLATPLLLVPALDRIGPECGLGDGGFHFGPVPDPVPRPDPRPGHGVSPGGATVECRREGVKVTFPAGRELLFAPDGYLHLRGGEVIGQFGGGVELQFLDGSSLRIARGGSHRTPIESVVLVRGNAGVRLWSGQDADATPVEAGTWLADREWCLGDGGALYRAIALGPLVTLQRRLLPKDLDPAPPPARLVLAVDAVLQSVQDLVEAQGKRVEREATPELLAVIEALPSILVADRHPPPRISAEPLRFVLRRGFVLQFVLAGAELRMELCHEDSQAPFLVWRLGYASEVAYAVRANEWTGQQRQPGQQEQRWSRPLRLPAPAPALAARRVREELIPAHAVLHQLQR
jgi:hypothetical protein